MTLQLNSFAQARALGWVLASMAAFTLAGVVAARPVRAFEVSTQERASLTAAVAKFRQATLQSDFATVVSLMPPRILAKLAETAQISVEAVKAAVVKQIEESQKVVTINHFTMADDKATFHALPDGSFYALVPTVTHVGFKVREGGLQQVSQTVALKEKGKWYFVRVGNGSQASALRQAYPQFKSVTFPKEDNKLVK